MMRRTVIFILFILLLPAGSQSLVTDLSNRKIGIRYSFQGADIILFGSIGTTKLDKGDDPYDIIVVVRGPERSTMVRRKERISGIWINAESLSFPAAPGYYAVAASRPLEEIGSPLKFAQAGIGFTNLRLAIDGGPREEERKQDYMKALARLKSSEGLYRDQEDAVTLLEEGLFRTVLRLPTNVPVGNYFVDTFIFQNGKIKGRNRIRLDVNKEGFERAVYTFAHGFPFLYGITAVIIALSAGWLAGILGKK